jgi:hypothetical protein
MDNKKVYSAFSAVLFPLKTLGIILETMSYGQRELSEGICLKMVSSGELP